MSFKILNQEDFLAGKPLGMLLNLTVAIVAAYAAAAVIMWIVL